MDLPVGNTSLILDEITTLGGGDVVLEAEIVDEVDNKVLVVADCTAAVLVVFG